MGYDVHQYCFERLSLHAFKARVLYPIEYVHQYGHQHDERNLVGAIQWMQHNITVSGQTAGIRACLITT